MQIKTETYGHAEAIAPESDVASLTWDGGMLLIRLAQGVENGLVRGLDIKFDGVRAFRVLDEVDLVRYWTSPHFSGGSHLCKVTRGGWLSEESELQGLERTGDEWLVITGNTCVSVVAKHAPGVEHASWPRDWEN